MTTAPAVRFLDRTTPPHIVTLILLAGVSALTMSIFLPSLSGMAVYFGVDYAVMQLAVSGYLATTAVLQVVIGPVSDRYGRRPVTLAALGIFIAATLGAMLAPTAAVFLFFRMFQGAVVTGIVLSRAIVRDMVPQEQAASKIGYVTMGMALVPMVGPMIGGALDQAFGWQAVFGFLALCGAGVLLLSLADQGETLASGGMGFREQVRTWPELLRSPRFWGYTICTAFASGAFFAFLGGASFVAQDIYGLNAFWTGVALGAPAVGYATGNFLSGRFSVAVGMNRMILLGVLATTFGLGLSLLLTVTGLGNAWTFFLLVTFMGLGNGMTLPNATAGLLGVRPHLAGTASGLGGAMMIGGGAALSALAGAVLSVESGSWPLQAIMLVSTLFSGVAIAYVIRRERQLGIPA
ncbi:multidrug effflux MFS transporter [Histidinibacterium lentulum]|uniref:Bcr/CflA family efflux transporter n=1 Tax=Histidinibacterium lentulum TaxID=2480588 RepID=A0A3N2QMH9_9RHOB|nr:multidrug effflux MFS transporter [Histidinibacterium lentulum]ROT96275.1 Bcr/CflA family efflux MFS transporter [Histidinibacterium lentulum]